MISAELRAKVYELVETNLALAAKVQDLEAEVAEWRQAAGAEAGEADRRGRLLAWKDAELRKLAHQFGTYPTCMVDVDELERIIAGPPARMECFGCQEEIDPAFGAAVFDDEEPYHPECAEVLVQDGIIAGPPAEDTP